MKKEGVTGNGALPCFVDATKHYLNRYPLLQELLARRIS